MANEADTDQLERDATEAHFVQKDDEAASKDYQEAAKAREDLGDDSTHAAEYVEDELIPNDPDDPQLRARALARRCEAATQYARAVEDLLAAAAMEDALHHGNAAARLRDEAKRVAAKALKWLETCLSLRFERGDVSRTLSSDWKRLGRFYDLVEREGDAERARRIAELVDELRRKAAQDAQSGLGREK